MVIDMPSSHQLQDLVITTSVVLGYPTPILVSKDLHYWHTLYISPASSEYNYFVNAAVWRDKVVAVTGKELLMFDSRDAE